MSKKAILVSSDAKANTSGTATTATQQRRSRKPRSRWDEESYFTGIRHGAEAMLAHGDSRDYVAEALIFQDIPFPSTKAPEWEGMWAFEDWDDWIAAEESESGDVPENAT